MHGLAVGLLGQCTLLAYVSCGVRGPPGLRVLGLCRVYASGHSAVLLGSPAGFPVCSPGVLASLLLARHGSCLACRLVCFPLSVPAVRMR